MKPEWWVFERVVETSVFPLGNVHVLSLSVHVLYVLMASVP